MNLSGTYIDRLLCNIMPYTIIIGLLYFLIDDKFNFILLFLISFILWICDTLIIYFKFRPSILKYDDVTGISFNKNSLKPNEIIKITQIKDSRMKWSFTMIKLTLAEEKNIFIIDKPKTIIEEIMNKPSKTLKMILKIYPELKSKLAKTEYV